MKASRLLLRFRSCRVVWLTKKPSKQPWQMLSKLLRRGSRPQGELVRLIQSRAAGYRMHNKSKKLAKADLMDFRIFGSRLLTYPLVDPVVRISRRCCSEW
ncbi:hypothetical protein SAMN05421881_105419 [Nitrosomonas halophila]|uniref:Uncharacterized protein n=1 Tax=Nitrosomonas halophila TaxID=44576 RepID=A0A1H3LXU9_9PROT|nr:hypothetical protein SAMN05421881_105419 [Nitrosomonas halophila]